MPGKKGWTLAQFGEYAFARLLAYLPIDWTSSIGAFLGARTGKKGIRARRMWVERLRKHLGKHFGITDRAAGEKKIIEFMARVGSVYAEFMVQQKIVRQGRLDLVGEQTLASIDRQVIITSCHLSNWELVGYVAAKLKRPVCIVYLPPNSPVEHHLALAARKRWPAQFELVPSSSATMRQVSKAILRGSNVLIFIDEEKDGYVAAPSLGRQIPYAGNRWYASRLAVKHNLDILPVHIEPKGKAAYRAVVAAPFSPPETGSDEQRARRLADMLDQHLNACISRLLEHWYWLPYFERDAHPGKSLSRPE